MKILRIIARLNIGGPARNAVLLSALGKTVLVCGEAGENEGNMMYLAREKGIKLVIVPELGRELSFVNDWKALWKIYRIICRERPDIVHTHTAKAGTLGRIAAFLYKMTGVKCKVVHTFHGHVLHSYFGKMKTWFFIWVEKILAIFTDRIVTVSYVLKKELSGIFRIAPEEKFSIVELGFELDELLGLSVRGEADYVNIGIVGRLVPVKNHKMLFKVGSRLKAQGLKVKIIVIGDGELRHKLEDYIRELDIEEIVEFKGWIKDLNDIYKELDILTLTSLNEGTPVSIIEAMAATRPVVATMVGGVGDIVQDRKSGYLVQSGDDEDFAEKLSDLIKDKEKRKRFGEYGRELVKDRFSKDRLIKDIEELYNRFFERK